MNGRRETRVGKINRERPRKKAPRNFNAAKTIRQSARDALVLFFRQRAYVPAGTRTQTAPKFDPQLQNTPMTREAEKEKRGGWERWRRRRRRRGERGGAGEDVREEKRAWNLYEEKSTSLITNNTGGRAVVGMFCLEITANSDCRGTL